MIIVLSLYFQHCYHDDIYTTIFPSKIYFFSHEVILLVEEINFWWKYCSVYIVMVTVYICHGNSVVMIITIQSSYVLYTATYFHVFIIFWHMQVCSMAPKDSIAAYVTAQTCQVSQIRDVIHAFKESLQLMCLHKSFIIQHFSRAM